MKGKVVAEVSIVPIGTADAGISRYIAASLEVLEGKKDLSYRLTPMGT
ncbi:MAG: thiamine-binding protein, partial [Dehalococcoidia bacterium]|nr:thiamine-binding protein [Dehalococcoidia bacterium]